MSRRIVIETVIKTISGQFVDTDLAEEVVAEMRQSGSVNLSFDENKKVFANKVNKQDENVSDHTLEDAKQLYMEKFQERNAEKMIKQLKKQGYKVEKIKQGKKIKIIAKQKIYN